MLQAAVPLMSSDMHAKLGTYYTSLQCHFAPAEAARDRRATARHYAAALHTQSREVESQSARNNAALRELTRARHRERMSATHAAR